jgi:small-conductance mechanosensitive channel
MSAVQILTDLWFTVVKLLGRPAVQWQLVCGLVTIFLAWLVARLIQGAWERRRIAARNRGRIPNSLPVEEVNRKDMADGPSASADDFAWSIEMEGGVYGFVRQLIFPVLAIGGVYVVNRLFVAQSWVNGLLVDLLGLLVIFLAYRGVMGLLYLVFEPAIARKYHQRLFAPLFGVFVVFLVLSRLTDVSTLMRAPLLPLPDATLTVGAFMAATFGLYFWIMLVALIRDVLQALLGRRRGANPGSLNAGLTLMQYGLIALGLFAVFRLLELNAATVAAITGGLSIGAGFALQDVLKNFLGGLIVLFEGTVRPGDWVEIAGIEGEVDRLSIRSTVVRTLDNVEFIVPNQDWLNSTVVTYTRSDRRARVRVPIGVTYNVDPHIAQQILVEAVSRHPDVLADPPPKAPVVDYGASSVDFDIQAWVDDAKYRTRIAGEVRLLVWTALSEHGIEIPYPQQDIHIRSVLPQGLIEASPTAG